MNTVGPSFGMLPTAGAAYTVPFSDPKYTIPLITIGDDSARLGRRFFHRTLPFFAFSAVIEPGTSDVMKMRPCAHAGDEAASCETLRCHTILPFFALTAY